MSELDGGSTLQRVAVSREDSGTYVCWAENRVGRVQAVSFVHVKGEAQALGFSLETGWTPSETGLLTSELAILHPGCT